MTLSDVSRALERAAIVPPRKEADLQDRLWKLLAPLRFFREAEVVKGQRPDFWLPDHKLIVEVKTQGGLLEVERQLLRYILKTEAQGVLLVTTRAIHKGVQSSYTRQGQAIPVQVLLLSGL